MITKREAIEILKINYLQRANNGNFIILFFITSFLRRVGSISSITSLSISTMGG